MTGPRTPRWSRQNTTPVAIALVAAVVPAMTLDAPRQIVFIGLIEGLSIGLLALGIILIYRTSRVINFDVGSIGALAATMLALTVMNYGWNYWFALGAALITGTAFAALIELTVITRLFNAARVILLVATIGIAQLADLFRVALPDLGIQIGARYPLPFTGEWTVAGLRITSAELIVIVLVPLITIGLSLLLGHTRLGKTVQALATAPPGTLVVAPTSVKPGNEKLTVRALLPSPIGKSMRPSSIVEYRLSSTVGLRRWISSMKSTSRSASPVSKPASTPLCSIAGPEVTCSFTPSSLATIWARVVLPRPGGPCSST